MKLQQVNLKIQQYELDKANYIKETFRISYTKLFRLLWSTDYNIDQLHALASKYREENDINSVLNIDWLVKHKIYFY